MPGRGWLVRILLSSTLRGHPAGCSGEAQRRSKPRHSHRKSLHRSRRADPAGWHSHSSAMLPSSLAEERSMAAGRSPTWSSGTLDVGGRTYRIARLAAVAEGRARRSESPAPLDSDPAREPAAARGCEQRHARRHRGAGQLGALGEGSSGDRVSARARGASGLHGCPRSPRSGCHARCDGRVRGRSRSDQPAVPGGSRRRSLRPRSITSARRTL